MHYSLGLLPFLHQARGFPAIQLVRYAVDEFLLLTGFRKIGRALVVDTSDNLFEPVNRIKLDVMAQILESDAPQSAQWT